jgi:hypothetical protein
MATKRIKPTRTAVRVKRRRPAAKKIARVRSSDAGDLTSKPMLIGFARVSTVDQNLALVASLTWWKLPMAVISSGDVIGLCHQIKNLLDRGDMQGLPAVNFA